MPLPEHLLDPIPGSSPSGEDLHYSALYDKVKEARRQEEEVPQGEWRREVKKADYPLVIKLATDAIATKSKDLQLAAWLTEAWLGQKGPGGLADGLDLLRGLVERVDGSGTEVTTKVMVPVLSMEPEIGPRLMSSKPAGVSSKPEKCTVE